MWGRMEVATLPFLIPRIASMNIVSSFVPFLQVFLLAMTEPTASSFLELVGGWLLVRGRSLADRIRASGSDRHPAGYYRVLSTASWSLEEVSRRLLRMLVRWAPAETLFLVGDDTLLPRKGPQIFAAGMHRDGTLSTRNRAVKRWGHAWVVL